MRLLLSALLTASMIVALTPNLASAQQRFIDDDDDVVGFDDDFPTAPPQQQPREKERPGKRGWRDSPALTGALAVGLCVAIPLGVWKIVMQFRQYQDGQGRRKQPWEIAMEEAERKRAK